MTPDTEIKMLRSKKWWTTVEVRRVYDVAAGRLHWWQARQKKALAARERTDTTGTKKKYWEYSQHAIHAFCEQYGVPLTDFGQAVMRPSMRDEEQPDPHLMGMTPKALTEATLEHLNREPVFTERHRVKEEDVEIAAMGIAYDALCQLDNEAKERALRWLTARVEYDLAKEEDDDAA